VRPESPTTTKKNADGPRGGLNSKRTRGAPARRYFRRGGTDQGNRSGPAVGGPGPGGAWEEEVGRAKRGGNCPRLCWEIHKNRQKQNEEGAHRGGPL